MTPILRFSWIPLALSLLSSPTVFGLGFRLDDQDAFATGRGEAFVATADNPSAIFFNPAGITQIDGLTARISGYGVRFPVDYTAPDGKSYRSKDYNQAYGDLYLTAEIKGTPFTVGIGDYIPWGLTVDYDDDIPFRTITTKASISFNTFNPVVAAKLTRTLSIAAGLTVNTASTGLYQGLAGAGLGTPGDEFKFKGSGSALGFNLGLLWQPTEQHSFGLRYQSATPIRFSGHTKVQFNSDEIAQFTAANEAIASIKANYGAFGENVVNGILDANGLPHQPINLHPREQDADATVMFPDIYTAGYSFRPTADWNFELDVDWTRWDSLGVVTLHNQDGTKAELPFNYRSSFLYSFGMTRYLPYGLHVSAGYIFSEETEPDRDYSPSVPDGQRHVFSVGLGQVIDRYTWDIAYQYTYAPDRAINNGTLADGVYKFSSHAITLSTSIKF